MSRAKIAFLRRLMGAAEIVQGMCRVVAGRAPQLSLRVAKAIARERGRERGEWFGKDDA